MAPTYRSREALIEQIGTCAALAEAADSTEEHLRWLAREDELRELAGYLTDRECEQIDTIQRTKVSEYTEESSHA